MIPDENGSIQDDGQSFGLASRGGGGGGGYYEELEHELQEVWLQAGEAGRRLRRFKSPPPTTDSKPEWKWTRKVDLLDKPLGSPVGYLPSFEPLSQTKRHGGVHATEPPVGGSPLYRVAGLDRFMTRSEAARALNKNKKLDQYVELGYTRGQHAVIICDAHGLDGGAWNGSTVATSRDVVTSKKEQLLNSRMIRHQPGAFPKVPYRRPFERFSGMVKKKASALPQPKD